MNTFQVGDKHYTIESLKAPGRSVAYVSDYDADNMPNDQLVAIAKAVGAPHIHTKRGDYPVLDAAWDNHNRTIINMKKEILQAALNAADLNDVEFSFSRKAGCSCGCSPGFKLKNLRGITYWVTHIK